MAYSYTVYTGDGSTTQYAVSFPYIRREHIAVTVAGIASTFTWVNNSLIQMDAAPANGAAVRVIRITPIGAPLVDFADGSTLVAADLDTSSRQSIYVQQELADAQVDTLGSLIPNGNKGDITTSASGAAWAINTGAVTSAKIADGTIVNADISSSAAIADTKLATIATPGKVANSATTAASANTASAIVARDASGNFTAGTITAGRQIVSTGTAVAPSIATGGLNTGIYSTAADHVGISANGSTGLVVRTIAPSSGVLGTNTVELPNGGNLAAFSAGDSRRQLAMRSNAVGSITAPTYGANGYATQYVMQEPLLGSGPSSNIHFWDRSALGTAGAPITFLRSMTINGNGSLIIDDTGSYIGDARLVVRGNVNPSGNSKTGIFDIISSASERPNYDEVVGRIRFSFQYKDCAWISCVSEIPADSEWYIGSPARLEFFTTRPVSSTPTPSMQIKSSGIINFSSVPIYSDNATAIAGGLVAGDVYRTDLGVLMIRF